MTHTDGGRRIAAEGRAIDGERAPRRQGQRLEHAFLRPLTILEDVLHYVVAVVLVAVAVVVLGRSVVDAFRDGQDFWAETIPRVINGVLFVVIVLEIFGTVVSHFRREGFQLRPFLIIGIVSGVRHILTVGAQTSLGHGIPANEFTRVMVEFGVNVGIVLGLVVGLVLVAHTDADRSRPSDQRPPDVAASRLSVPPFGGGVQHETEDSV